MRRGSARGLPPCAARCPAEHPWCVRGGGAHAQALGLLGPPSLFWVIFVLGRVEESKAERAGQRCHGECDRCKAFVLLRGRLCYRAFLHGIGWRGHRRPVVTHASHSMFWKLLLFLLVRMRFAACVAYRHGAHVVLSIAPSCHAPVYLRGCSLFLWAMVLVPGKTPGPGSRIGAGRGKICATTPVEYQRVFVACFAASGPTLTRNCCSNHFARRACPQKV